MSSKPAETMGIPNLFLYGAAAAGAVGTAAALAYAAYKRSAIRPAADLTVGYWAIRGLAAPLRMMCVYAGQPFKNTMYTFAESNKWLKEDKVALKCINPLMNLPYVVHDSKVITQSNACMASLARRYNLVGPSEDDCDQLLCEVMDLRNNAVRLFYGGPSDKSEFTAAVVTHLKSVSVSYSKLDGWLKVRGASVDDPFLQTGSKPTAPDFHLWEMIDQHEALAADYMQPSPIASFPRLIALHSAFRKLPQLASYFAGDMYRLPPNNTMAKWGNKSPVRDGKSVA